MGELVEWLRAQLDEDERTARVAVALVGHVPGVMHWRSVEGLSDSGGTYWCITSTPPEDTVPVVELVGSGMSGGGVHGEALAAFIAEWDPARVLREIDAKRRILDTLHEEGGDRMFADIFRLLALPYADRPGYQEPWRP